MRAGLHWKYNEKAMKELMPQRNGCSFASREGGFPARKWESPDKPNLKGMIRYFMRLKTQKICIPRYSDHKPSYKQHKAFNCPENDSPAVFSQMDTNDRDSDALIVIRSIFSAFASTLIMQTL
jgi:hypothetical protein